MKYKETLITSLIRWFCRVFLGKRLLISNVDDSVALAWGPNKGDIYFSVSTNDSLGSCVSGPHIIGYDFEMRDYAEGKRNHYFKQKAHAEEASKRIQKVLEEYHQELGY